MSDLDFADFLVLGGAGLFVLGYLIINQVILRVMLLAGTVLYIWYYAIVDDAPLWPAIFASLSTLTANLLGLIGLLYRRSAFAIPRKFRELYPLFPNLPPGGFRKLMQVAEHVVRAPGYVLTTEGERVGTLYYVIDGAMQVDKNKGSFPLAANTFVGEVAFMTGNPASATVRLSTQATLLEWDVTKLKRKADRDPRFRLALDALISLDLADKVSRSVRTESEADLSSV